jgi:hypothetical protein
MLPPMARILLASLLLSLVVGFKSPNPNPAPKNKGNQASNTPAPKSTAHQVAASTQQEAAVNGHAGRAQIVVDIYSL